MLDMVETIKQILGIYHHDFDFMLAIFGCVIIIFVMRYLLELFAFIFKFIGGYK